jgi:hypothetical protein
MLTRPTMSSGALRIWRDITMKFKMSKSIKGKVSNVTHHMKRSPECKYFISQSAYVTNTAETRLFYQEI